MNTTAFFDFAISEDGAVTVDWVVLTAALVGLGFATMAVVSGGVGDLSNDINAELMSMEVQTSFDQEAWAAGAPLYFTQDQWNSNRDFFATRDAGINNFGANEALGLAADVNRNDRAYQLDQAGATIAALSANGEDTTELQAQYDAIYGELSGTS